MLDPGFTTRFAPAPTGHLHLGHAVNAVWVWGIARAYGGRVLLRVEDHDHGRCRPEYEASLLDDLDWLGLVPDGASPAVLRRGPHAQRQSDDRARYADRLTALEADGLAYPCRCSRADVERAHPVADGAEPRYPGTCRTAGVPPDETPARRITIADGVEPFDDLRLGAQTQRPAADVGDVLVRDRLGQFTYQFAVTVDDFEQRVDLIIRGEDLLASTGRQFRIARMLGRLEMPQVLHHPLVRHPDGRKLSKSAADTGLRELRAAGRTAADVLGMAAHASGLLATPRPVEARALADLFESGGWGHIPAA
ncbi:MAG: glutamate--tRNA ligase family protein [Gemmatimonadota bacterium]|nr:glutamate--tRNA ligase family protein [Gemmatimonadota bacterium]MDQ8147852.1 glutamate--tRNA ligase family protein [Gemmatimonadota bacterium]MDQ8149496.1 glutamate--tRNA ligase family protein [Gemmatimonadota bacterium]MDQ8177158.1 glutamate--tRNA ligase family protein [Gemmatimonadota bacterium]